MGYCLYKVGCKGPVTYNACSATRWNEGLSFPIQSGHGCIGCSEDAFWDKGSFYDHLTTIRPPGLSGIEGTADQIGLGLAAVAGAGIAAHAAISAIKQARSKSAQRQGERGGGIVMAAYQTQGFTLDNSGKRIVVDPITRIEGHLRIEVNVDKDNVIRNAVSTGTMWRGLEVILKGRDPRDAWAFAERICGVCTGVHALASVRAVEDAIGIQIPKNANIIRNLMHATLYAQDHLVHFYHLHALDWVDVVSALKADPKRTSEIQQSISNHPNSSPGYFREVQNRLKKFVESGQLGIFANAYWGHPAYKLPPEVNLLATTHYLEALDFQKDIVKIQTIFGGKNPHPNWLVGGVPSPLNVDGTGAVGAINMALLNFVGDICNRTAEFIDQVYIPDLLAIAGFYKDWAKWGGGLSSQNVMSYGEFPEIANDYSNASLGLPSGVIIGGDLKNVQEVDLKDPDAGPGVGHALLVQVRRRIEGPAPVRRRDRGELRARAEHQGHAHRHQGARRGRQVLVGQVAALERPCGRGRTARALPRGLRARPAGHQGAGRRRAQGARRADHGAVLDAGPHRGARPGVPVGRAQDEEVLRRAHRQHQGRRSRDRQHREMGAVELAGRVQGRRADAKRRAARSATGSRSRTPGSTSTRPSCRRRGTPDRATPRARSAPTRRRCSTRRWRSPSSRSRSCAPSTASIPASRARRT